MKVYRKVTINVRGEVVFEDSEYCYGPVAECKGYSGDSSAGGSQMSKWISSGSSVPSYGSGQGKGFQQPTYPAPTATSPAPIPSTAVSDRTLSPPTGMILSGNRLSIPPKPVVVPVDLTAPVPPGILSEEEIKKRQAAGQSSGLLNLGDA